MNIYKILISFSCLLETSISGLSGEEPWAELSRNNKQLFPLSWLNMKSTLILPSAKIQSKGQMGTVFLFSEKQPVKWHLDGKLFKVLTKMASSMELR